MVEKLIDRELLRQELRPMYQQLLDKLSFSYPPEIKLTGFSPLIGSQFEMSESRLLLCGRAVDGWRNEWHSNSPTEESLRNIFKIPEADRTAACEMNWLQRSRKNWADDRSKGYNYKSSSFWTGARDVIKQLEGNPALQENQWQANLTWSNVYKISPADTGNPGDKLRSIQIEYCIKILQHEIHFLRPKNILFVTGGWGKKILEALDIYPYYDSQDIVQFSGKVNGANVVVTVRPERQKRNRWVKEVVSAFQKLPRGL